MPREGANRLAQFAVALQWDRGRWLWLLLILLSLDLVLGLGDSVARAAALRSRRHRGRRLVAVAHGAHGAPGPASLDPERARSGADVVAVRRRTMTRSSGASSSCPAALAISRGLWWLSPRVAWYVGASGVLHSIMAAGCAEHLAERAWDRWILLVCLCAKLAYEQLGGHEPPMVVVDAHLYGAACGFAVGAALSWRTAIIRRRSRA